MSAFRVVHREDHAVDRARLGGSDPLAQDDRRLRAGRSQLYYRVVPMGGRRNRHPSETPVSRKSAIARSTSETGTTKTSSFIFMINTLYRIDGFNCRNNGTGVVWDIHVESGMHLLI